MLPIMTTHTDHLDQSVVALLEGDTLEINCSVSDTSVHNVSHLVFIVSALNGDSQSLYQSRANLSIYITEVSSYTKMLRIHNVTLGDTAKYMCRNQKTRLAASKSVRVAREYMPP